MKFEGTSSYIATDDLKVAVNAAVTLERPLLIKGEPGTGKTVLAHQVAQALEAGRCIEWHIKSTTKAQQGLYEYDAVVPFARFSQFGRRARQGHYAITSRRANCGKRSPTEGETAPILLIDEIDKADIEFPNDLLQELDRMEFYRIRNRTKRSQAAQRPIVFITSNNEKELPDAFLRRCFFHLHQIPGQSTRCRTDR